MFAIISFAAPPTKEAANAIGNNETEGFWVSQTVCLISSSETIEAIDHRVEKIFGSNRYVLFERPARKWFTNITDQKLLDWVNQKLEKENELPPPVLVGPR